MLLLAGILVILTTLAVVLGPLVLGTPARLSDGPDVEAQIVELRAIKAVIYESIRDLEYDFHAGKIDEADYRELSERSKREALTIMQRLDALQALPDRPRDPGRGGS